MPMNSWFLPIPYFLPDKIVECASADSDKTVYRYLSLYPVLSSGLTPRIVKANEIQLWPLMV